MPFFLLISIRQHILPKFFHPFHLQELDAAEYEEIAGSPRRARNMSMRVFEAYPLILSILIFFINLYIFGFDVYIYFQERQTAEDDDLDGDAFEMLDEMTTSRGEFKVRTASLDTQVRIQFVSFWSSDDNLITS